jgi:hypothetical protein
LRDDFKPRVERIRVPRISFASQPFVLWWNREMAARHMRAPGKDASPDVGEFCRVFPDSFFVTDRAPFFDTRGGKRGQLLAAGFHLQQGYFRDDEPLCKLVLDEAGRRELDALWQELDFVTLVPLRQYRDFIFYERTEAPCFIQDSVFDFARSEDKEVTSEPKIEHMRIAYLTKARKIGASEVALGAIESYFQDMAAAIHRVEESRRNAEPSHLRALEQFAERAYRRPLSRAERDDLVGFYQALRRQDGLSREDAMRDTITSVLMSPHFCYRIDSAKPGTSPHPLSDYALVSRLSYFLWASMPDAELLAAAARDELHKPEVLLAQTRRMLQDDRVRGFTVEFAGNWLGFRRFEEHNAVDRERFAQFTDELRQAMYEEPIRFFLDVVRRDRSVLDFLFAGDTFVNSVLARHYGIRISGTGPDEWVRVVHANRYGRGGFLPMAVFLTANSPGLRTSPVKRGNWVVRRLLGERIPAPPAEVPELPKDEARTGNLTLPQLLARHREEKSCATCHQRFDSIGLVFEEYGPIGERREWDLGGRLIEAKATFPDNSTGEGLDGLRRYLSERRRDEFVDNLCRKLLAYALGRGLLPSDEATIKMMRGRLSSEAHRFGTLIEVIVTSPQFLNRRGRDDPRE